MERLQALNAKASRKALAESVAEIPAVGAHGGPEPKAAKSLRGVGIEPTRALRPKGF